MAVVAGVLLLGIGRFVQLAGERAALFDFGGVAAIAAGVDPLLS